MNVQKSLKPALMMAAMTAMMEMGDHVFGEYDNRVHNGVNRISHPWDRIQLTKAERKGKSYEELQDMRKAKWGSNHALDRLDGR